MDRLNGEPRRAVAAGGELPLLRVASPSTRNDRPRRAAGRVARSIPIGDGSDDRTAQPTNHEALVPSVIRGGNPRGREITPPRRGRGEASAQTRIVRRPKEGEDGRRDDLAFERQPKGRS